MKIELNHEKPQVKAFLNLLKSPEHETSIVKGVPLELLESVKKLIRESFPDKKIRVKYRGPRHDRYTTLKRDAKNAAIYFTGDYGKYFR